jgi:hypothetical protein
MTYLIYDILRGVYGVRLSTLGYALLGVALVTARVIVLELMADNAHPKANQIYAALPAGLITMDTAPGA